MLPSFDKSAARWQTFLARHIRKRGLDEYLKAVDGLLYKLKIIGKKPRGGNFATRLAVRALESMDFKSIDAQETVLAFASSSEYEQHK
jgi:hypothetical protein